MRIEMYSAPDRCLYVHEPDLEDWIDTPWIRQGERRVSIRDLTQDPGINEVSVLVFHSSDDPDWRNAPPRIRNGRLYFNVGSAEQFLDAYTADWLLESEGEWQRSSLRDLDKIGVITGPVDRIVLLDVSRSWPAGARKRADRTLVRHMRRPWMRRPWQPR